MIEQTVKCQICGKEFEHIPRHLRSHKISRDEYIKMFPNAKLISDKMSEKLSKNTTKQLSRQWKDSVYRNKKTEKQREVTRKQWETNIPYRELMTRINKENNAKQMSDPEYVRYISDKLTDTQKKDWELDSGKIIKCRSSFEFAMYNFLDKNDFNFEYETLWIPYIDCKGTNRHYKPDFYINNLNLIIEVKPYKKMVTEDENYYKQQACLNLGYKFIFITEKELFNPNVDILSLIHNS